MSVARERSAAAVTLQEPGLDVPLVTPTRPGGDDTVCAAMEEAPLTSSASRLPPDGHEFPPNYTEHNPFTVGNPALIELELEKPPPPLPTSGPPPRKCSGEEPRSPVRAPAWRKDEKSECSVKDKIAMFSSSEDVFLESRPPTRSLPPEKTLDLPGTLPRKTSAAAATLSRATSFSGRSLHTRSQSLIDIGTVEDMRKASLIALIEQRRRGISKLRGLVIPEKVSETHTICDLPEIRSRDSILSKAPPPAPTQRPSRWSAGQQSTATSTSPPVMSSPPWKTTSATNLPKYSPAFKRKSLTVCGSSASSRSSAEPPASLESGSSPTRSDVSFDFKSARRSTEEDSDVDDSPPPTPPPPPLLSPLRRTLSSETCDRRVLKPQSVEAINRKNVLSSARYSSGAALEQNCEAVVARPTLAERNLERVAYLNEVEEEQKPLPAPRRAPVPVQRKLLEAGPEEEEEADLLSVLTGGRGSQLRRQLLGDNRRSVSVHDIRKAFEKAEMALASSGRRVNHARVSSLDSTGSEDSFTPQNLHHEQFGSVTSIASSTSLISPQELQVLIDEANQPLEDSAGTMAMPVHDVVVVVLHREGTTGSVGITLAGGADYEAKEITVHKVLAGSPADRDGRVQKGDRILSINGRSMKGVTHRESLNILKAPRPEVVLVVSRSRGLLDGNHDASQLDDCPVTTHIQRPSRPPRIPEQPLEAIATSLVTAEGDDRGPPIAITLTKDGAGLGFSLEGGKDSPLGDKPLTIKKIFTGGSAEKNGQLRAGDELLNVNGSDVTVLSRIEAWGLMKRLSDGPIALTIRHRLNK